MDSPDVRDYLAPMDRNRAGILYGICFILFSVIMAGWHYVLTGFGSDFGTGAAVGFLFAFGLLALLSRKVRELP